MVARSSAFETTEHMTAKVCRKGAVLSPFAWFMKRTSSSHLVARALEGDKTQQLQNLCHGYVGSQLPKIDTGHGKLNKNREEESVFSYTACACY